MQAPQSGVGPEQLARAPSPPQALPVPERQWP
jgi:hypothetical protein